MADIGLLGAPNNSAGTTDGVARAPTALREAGLIEVLERASDVRDYGDVPLPVPSPSRDPRTHVIDPEGLQALVAGVREGVEGILGDGRFPIVVGGDCPVLLGCLAALGDADRGLLFVDGHEDAYPPERSTTGEAADMELGFALGIVDVSWWLELEVVSPLVSMDRACLLGPRDRAAIEAEGGSSLADRLALRDAASLTGDPAGVTEAALRSLPSPWWFHLDLDVLSTEALPAIDYPQAGGLSWEDLDVVARTALAGSPAGWDVTIYNPDLDPDRVHADRIVRFLGSAAGSLDGA